ncbi:MAG TPA: hypothetical protein G4O05_03465 [Caldilineae bacterium]|nr:hypothetical protein [Caldilineae bacterium]
MKTLRSASFWTALLLTIFAIAPLLRPGYFWAAHDARHDVYFILQYNITWNEGVLFPRWSPDWAFGYGYPFFNIYAPGATFLGTLLYRTLHLSLENAVKATFIVTLLISAWGMWLFVRDWLDERAALVAAAAYVYAPYHLLDVYVRAAMAENLALALLPLSLWAVRRAVFRPGPLTIALTALTYAAIHLSSNLVALLFTPVLGLYLLFLACRRLASEKPPLFSSASLRPFSFPRGKLCVRRLLAPAAGLVLGVALAAFFILPALLESKFVNREQWYGGYYDFHDHFVYFAQLFDPRWGFGISTPGPNDPLSYQLGLALVVLAALAGWVWWKRPGGKRAEIGFWLVILLGSMWLTTGASTLAWDHIPGVAMAQFPWRYLSLTALALAILAPVVLMSEVGGQRSEVEGEGDQATKRPGDYLMPLLLAGLIILASSPYLRVEITDPPPGGATLAGLMEFERSSDEMTGMTSTAQEIATWSPLADLHMAGIPVTTQVDYGLVHANPNLAVDARSHRVTEETVWVHADVPGQRVPFLRQWYPGWTATILNPDTGEVLDRFPLTPEDARPPYGLLSVPVPEGDFLLRIAFEDTPVRKAGNAISIVALMVILGLILGGGRSAVRKGRRWNLSAE